MKVTVNIWVANISTGFFLNAKEACNFVVSQNGAYLEKCP